MFLWNVSDVLYGGIRPDIPGHGGAQCAAYLSKPTMILETVLSTSIMTFVGVLGYYTYTMPRVVPAKRSSTFNTFLLVLLCVVFGVEIGYKLSSRQVLYLLNPCHVITVIEVIRFSLFFNDYNFFLQIFLLASGPSRASFAMLR